MDRRVIKTKNAIYEALILLMAEKNFEQITINEIAKKADINRGTIYFHFEDKYDLLNQCIKSHIEQLFNSCSADTPQNLMTRTLNYLKENLFVFQTLLNENSIVVFRNELKSMIIQSLERQYSDESSLPSDFTNQFFSSAVVGVLEWWILNSMPYSVEQMVGNFSEIFRDLNFGNSVKQ